MLTAIYGKCPDVIFPTSKYFDSIFKDEWMDDPLVKQMIMDVDGSEVLGNRVIKCPILGLISPKDISGGVKTLILIYKMQDKIFNGSQCGGVKCGKWMLKLGKMYDIKIWLFHRMEFFEIDPCHGEDILDIDIIYDNLSKKVHIRTFEDYLDFYLYNEEYLNGFYC